ncbi:ATP-binding protein [Paraflavisolibacter sp. H34]|uniref:sensor histidine kinase n=1 Tax=Huijunlia imazamoxiresistens TaxID=3127457 RepID=UPI003017BC9E
MPGKSGQHIADSEKQLRLILESAKGFAIFTTTADGRVNTWNAGAAGIFGWSEEEILGQPGDVLFTPQDREQGEPQKEMATAVAKGVAPDVRWHLRKDGSLVFIDGANHPLFDNAGTLTGFVKIGRDMTAQRQAEVALRKAEEDYRTRLEKEVEQRTAELKESNTSLRQANENLQQFASIASHDLQEPLRKLKLFAAVLRRFSDHLPEEGKELLQKISETSARMSQLIRELLQYSKIAYGTREMVPTDLQAVVQNVQSDLDLLIRETGAVILLEGPLPRVMAVPLQMHQLFHNLLTNALKFRKKDVPPSVRISCSFVAPEQLQRFPGLDASKTYMEIIVADNGIGFAQIYAEQIFQIFERLHPAEEYEGTGLGLALCKKIVENHAGHIFAESRQGEGAAFYIWLPVHP